MSNLLDKTRPADPQAEREQDALAEVIFQLKNAMKPKARAKARQSLEAYVARLETFEGCPFPLTADVTPLAPFRRHGGRFEQALASEAQRRERAERAAALRAVIGRVL